MLAYLYDENTKEYKGYTEAQLDPLESEAQGKDVYLIPANATFTQVLEQKAGYAILWKNTKWEYEVDKRGLRYIAPNLNPQSIFTVTKLGEPEGYFVSDELWAEYTTGKRKVFSFDPQGKLIVIQREPTIQEQIDELENSVTKRNTRAALAGDEVALQKIKDVEAQIEELRKQL